jgi:hypothetical protein
MLATDTGWHGAEAGRADHQRHVRLHVLRAVLLA